MQCMFMMHSLAMIHLRHESNSICLPWNFLGKSYKKKILHQKKLFIQQHKEDEKKCMANNAVGHFFSIFFFQIPLCYTGRRPGSRLIRGQGEWSPLIPSKEKNEGLEQPIQIRKTSKDGLNGGCWRGDRERERERELLWRFGTAMSQAILLLCNHFGRASSGSARLYIYIYSTHLSQHAAAYVSITSHTSAYVWVINP